MKKKEKENILVSVLPFLDLTMVLWLLENGRESDTGKSDSFVPRVFT